MECAGVCEENKIHVDTVSGKLKRMFSAV